MCSMSTTAKQNRYAEVPRKNKSIKMFPVILIQAIVRGDGHMRKLRIDEIINI